MKEKRVTITWVNVKLVVIAIRMYPTGWATLTLDRMMESHLDPACASSQLTPKGQSWQKPEQTKVIAQPPISSVPSTLCHQSLRLCWYLRWSGLSHRHAHLPLRICSFRAALVSTEKWQFCTYLKKKAVCGFETKYGVLGAKVTSLKRWDSQNLFITHICPLSMQEVLANSWNKNLQNFVHAKQLLRNNNSYPLLEWLQISNKQLRIGIDERSFLSWKASYYF